MSELAIPTNTLRKRTSSASIRECEDSRKKARETTEQKTISTDVVKSDASAEIGPRAETSPRRHSDYSKVDNGLERVGVWVEKKPRKRVQLLKGLRKCCGCPRQTRFRNDGICGKCGHQRCAECMLE